jgi:molybdopterin converting factor subunit 1
MNIEVLAFGIVREIVAGASIRLDVNTGLTVHELLVMLKERYPALTGVTSIAVAINGSYAAADAVIQPNDEIAIIPPVSGG